MPNKNDTYIALARKYRPRKLSDFKGQEEICNILKGALINNRLSHAYLLSGTRGVGKTSLARIIAKIVNCESTQESIKGEPCGKCKTCISINDEKNIDVIEIDAASKTGVGDIREIIENINYRPVAAIKKIYIIDEVHMLSKAAFNALLKTLEEPPRDVIFLLATTETEKIPVTILSRCQHLQLKRLDTETLKNHIIQICKTEEFSIDNESASLIARSSEGSVRDALSILDNVLTKGLDINKKIVQDTLGLSDIESIYELFRMICEGDVLNALKSSSEFNLNGVSFELLSKDLLEIIYHIAKYKSSTDILDDELTEYEKNKLKDFSKILDMDVIIRFWELMQKYLLEISEVHDQKQYFEMIIIRLCYVSIIPTPFEENQEKLKINIQDNNKLTKPVNEENERNNIIEEYRPQNNLALEIEHKKKDKYFIKQNDTENQIKDFQLLINLLEKSGEFILSHDLINNYELVSIKKSEKLDIADLLELKNIKHIDVEKNTLWKVSKSLEKVTQKRWVVSLSNKPGIINLAEYNRDQEQVLKKKLSDDKSIKKLLEIIPKSKVTSINKLTNKEEYE